jgi:hypothetical protein
LHIGQSLRIMLQTFAACQALSVAGAASACSMDTIFLRQSNMPLTSNAIELVRGLCFHGSDNGEMGSIGWLSLSPTVETSCHHDGDFSNLALPTLRKCQVWHLSTLSLYETGPHAFVRLLATLAFRKPGCPSSVNMYSARKICNSPNQVLCY